MIQMKSRKPAFASFLPVATIALLSSGCSTYVTKAEDGTMMSVYKRGSLYENRNEASYKAYNKAYQYCQENGKALNRLEDDAQMRRERASDDLKMKLRFECVDKKSAEN